MSYENRVYAVKKCDQCGIEFVPLNGRQVRCSAQCSRVKNREQKLVKSAQYREDHREELRIKNREYAAKNQVGIIARRKRNWAKNKDDPVFRSKPRVSPGYMARYSQERREKDPAFRVGINARRRLLHALKGNLKPKRTFDYIGCTTAELKAWLEKQFRPGMDWGTYGPKGWHIDHKRPLASFQLIKQDGSVDEGQLHAAMHFTNLQPLWYWENIAKSDNFVAL